jgi:hypothetical protein
MTSGEVSQVVLGRVWKRNSRSLHGTPRGTPGQAGQVHFATLLTNKRRVWRRTSGARPPAYGPSPSGLG